MLNFEYRTELNAWEKTQPIIVAAFEVAKRAHAGQSRKKIDPSIMYISHPLMVAEIMERMGVKDPIVIAAAMLHDSLEDAKRYAGKKGDPKEFYERMHDDLALALKKTLSLHPGEGVADFGSYDVFREIVGSSDPATREELTRELAETAAYQIFRLVKEVTKPKIYPEGMKLAAQIDHIRQSSLDGKILKIADQIASLLDRIHLANDPKKFTREKEKEFTEKATTLVRALLASARNDAEREAMKPWGRLFTWALAFTQQVDKRESKEEIADIRKQIDEVVDFNGFFTPEALGKDISMELPQPRINQRYYSIDTEIYRPGMPEAIVRRVDFDASGRIARCVLRRGTEEGHPLNGVRNRWFDAFPILNRFLHPSEQVTHHMLAAEVIALGEGDGRAFQFRPHIDADVFGAMCEASHLCTDKHVKDMKKMARNINKDAMSKEPWKKEFISAMTTHRREVAQYLREHREEMERDTIEVPVNPDSQTGITRVTVNARGEVLGYRMRWVMDEQRFASIEEMQHQLFDKLSIPETQSTAISDPKGFRRPTVQRLTYIEREDDKTKLPRNIVGPQQHQPTFTADGEIDWEQYRRDQNAQRLSSERMPQQQYAYDSKTGQYRWVDKIGLASRQDLSIQSGPIETIKGIEEQDFTLGANTRINAAFFTFCARYAGLLDYHPKPDLTHEANDGPLTKPDLDSLSSRLEQTKSIMGSVYALEDFVRRRRSQTESWGDKLNDEQALNFAHLSLYDFRR